MIVPYFIRTHTPTRTPHAGCFGSGGNCWIDYSAASMPQDREDHRGVRRARKGQRERGTGCRWQRGGQETSGWPTMDGQADGTDWSSDGSAADGTECVKGLCRPGRVSVAMAAARSTGKLPLQRQRLRVKGRSFTLAATGVVHESFLRDYDGRFNYAGSSMQQRLWLQIIHRAVLDFIVGNRTLAGGACRASVPPSNR